MGLLEELQKMYDFSELINKRPKLLVESKMSKRYKRIYYFLQYTRRIAMALGLISLIMFFYNKKWIFIELMIFMGIIATGSSVITKKMRQYIIRTYNL